MFHAAQHQAVSWESRRPEERALECKEAKSHAVLREKNKDFLQDEEDGLQLEETGTRLQSRPRSSLLEALSISAFVGVPLAGKTQASPRAVASFFNRSSRPRLRRQKRRLHEACQVFMTSCENRYAIQEAAKIATRSRKQLGRGGRVPEPSLHATLHQDQMEICWARQPFFREFQSRPEIIRSGRAQAPLGWRLTPR